MNYGSPEKIILTPIMTEKSLMDQAKGKYSFWVNKAASKFQIIEAFKSIFSINPLQINTIKLKGKNKTDWKRRRPINKPDRKKAIISIPKDKKIESLVIKSDKK